MKSLPEIKKGFTFAPRESGSSLRDWQAGKKREMRISLKKKLHKKLAGLKKDFYFCTRFLKHGNGTKTE